MEHYISVISIGGHREGNIFGGIIEVLARNSFREQEPKCVMPSSYVGSTVGEDQRGNNFSGQIRKGDFISIFMKNF